MRKFSFVFFLILSLNLCGQEYEVICDSSIYETGELAGIGCFKTNLGDSLIIPIGQWIHFYKSGALRDSTFYDERGREVGITKMYYEDGKIWQIWNHKSDTIFVEEYWRKNRRTEVKKRILVFDSIMWADVVEVTKILNGPTIDSTIYADHLPKEQYHYYNTGELHFKKSFNSEHQMVEETYFRKRGKEYTPIRLPWYYPSIIATIILTPILATLFTE